MVCHLQLKWRPPRLHNGNWVDKYHVRFSRRIFSYVKRRVVELDEWLELADFECKRLQHTFSSLPPGIMHRAKVRTHTLAGWTEWTPWTLMKTISCAPDAPAPITKVRAVRAPWNGGQFIYIEWTDPIPNGEPIEAFEVQCRRKGREEWSTCSEVIHPRTMGFTAAFCHGKPLRSDTWHELRVRARNSKVRVRNALTSK